MHFFLIEPEVAGGLGERTVMDRSVHPPVVTHLHYQFDGWLGDAIVESFPVFVVTQAARHALSAPEITGARFAEVEATASNLFEELHPKRTLPGFAWLQPSGEAGHDDVAVTGDGRLILSARALAALRELGLTHALVAPLAAG